MHCKPQNSVRKAIVQKTACKTTMSHFMQHKNVSKSVGRSVDITGITVELFVFLKQKLVEQMLDNMMPKSLCVASSVSF